MADKTVSYRAELADGRIVVVDAGSQNAARLLAREQSGGVGVTKIERYTDAKQKADAKAAEDAAKNAEDDDDES